MLKSWLVTYIEEGIDEEQCVLFDAEDETHAGEQMENFIPEASILLIEEMKSMDEPSKFLTMVQNWWKDDDNRVVLYTAVVMIVMTILAVTTEFHKY